jgi:predicted protein tyrosine phosphatase
MIHILSEREMLQNLDRAALGPSACVSIGDPGSVTPTAVADRFPELLRLEFYDIVEAESGRTAVPEISDLEKAIEFYKRNRKKELWVHSFHGFGRAPAIALGFLFLGIGEEEKAGAELKRLCPKALPNKRIVLLYDLILGSDLKHKNYAIWIRRIQEMRRSIESVALP